MNLNPAALQNLPACINQIENEINDLLQIQADWVPDEQLNFAQFRETINDLRIVLGVHAANYPARILNQIGVLLGSIEQLLYNYNHANDPPDLNQTIINDYTTRLNELRAELVGVPDNHLQGEFAEVHADNESGSWCLTIVRVILTVLAVTFISSFLRPRNDGVTLGASFIPSEHIDTRFYSYPIRPSFLSLIQNFIEYYTNEMDAEPFSRSWKYKEAEVKREMSEEMNDPKKPRSDRHTIGANDPDSSAESEWSGVNTAGVKLSSEAVDLSNEHAEVSLSGEVASSNNDEGQRVLSVVDEGNHHNENNHWTSSMNDENNQGEANPSPPLSGEGARDDGCSDEDIQQDNLFTAVKSNNLTRLEELWRCGLRNMTVRDEDGNSLLHHSVWQNSNTTIASFLINHGAEVNAVDQGGKTALHLASHQGYLEVARLLLESGSNVDQVDTDKHTALHYAAHECHKEVAELLIARSADVNAKEQHGQSALFYAINRGCSSVAELLLKSKAVNIGIIDMWGYTALHYATEQNMVTVVQSLCQDGSRQDIFNELGFTPLHLAVQKGNIDMVEVLLEAGANINQASLVENQTVVHMAAKRGDKKLLRYLLDLGAQCDVLDEDGHSAYALAKDAGHDYLLDLLKKCPAAANRKSSQSIGSNQLNSVKGGEL